MFWSETFVYFFDNPKASKCYKVGPGSSYIWGYNPYKWPKINGFHWDHTPTSRDDFTPFTTGFWAHLVILLMAEILHQLRLVVYPIIYRVSYIPGGARFQPSTVSLNMWELWR